jgi:predicted TIM-barrel fold metal-dependent hydrolase
MARAHQPIFDSHLHILDPVFPLVSNRGYLPDPFTIEDYRAQTASLDIVGGAVVSASFQGFDQSYLRTALQRLGPSFVGVAQLPANVSDEEILALNTTGVRAIRFNLYRGGQDALEQLSTMAQRVYDLAKWHSELYVDARDLPDLETSLKALPKVSIDHLGLSQEGFKSLLQLVEHGVYVKATGFGRVDLDIPNALRAIHAANPHALLFGTDLPSPRAKRPFQLSDVKLVLDALGEEAERLVLYENAVDFYSSI